MGGSCFLEKLTEGDWRKLLCLRKQLDLTLQGMGTPPRPLRATEALWGLHWRGSSQTADGKRSCLYPPPERIPLPPRDPAWRPVQAGSLTPAIAGFPAAPWEHTASSFPCAFCSVSSSCNPDLSATCTLPQPQAWWASPGGSCVTDAARRGVFHIRKWRL